jgi:ABC-2 type transport system ATP-binding protein
VAAIHTENLSKTYGGGLRGKKSVALRGLTLEVREGEIFGFLGPNGAGKTSTIHLLLNLIRPTSGSASLFGLPVTDAEVHRRVGYLPESVNLHDYYHGRKLLNFYAVLAGVPDAARSGRVAEMLRLFALEDAADKVVSKYSKGMAQRIGFAQALLHDPDLLLLDEPTSSLDPVGRKEFRDILLELKRRGKTVFISSHILSEVETVCDRVAILQQGELKRIGTLQELSAGRSTKFIVKSLPAPALESIAATAAEITLAQGLVTIRCQNESCRKEIECLLELHGVQITQRETVAQSLEEIFFSTINSSKTS